MNHQIPNFENEDDGHHTPPPSYSITHPKESEGEIMELIWQNGQIMIHNQTRRSVATSSSSQTPLPQPPPNPQLFIAEDEMAAWLHYPFEHLYPDPTPPTSSPPPPPPPHFEAPPSRPPAPAPRKPSEPARTELTVVESNEVPTLAASPVRGGRGASPRYDDDDDDEGSIYDMTVTSSSSSEMESETSATETDTGSGYDDDDDDGETVKYGDVEDRKRKEKNDDDDATSSERLFEDVELDSVDDEEHTNGSTSTKRSRASEVHNLSERRRRDRINEKMRALQELIPRSNKSDRASMLDEAIAYLKTLQMRVQMMTMGCGMVPMMYPGIQQPYMPPAGMGMGMSMGMGMDMGMNHPVMPFMSALPGSAAVPTQLTSGLPASAFPMHPVPAHGFSVMHPSNQPDSTNTPYHLHGGGLPQSSNVADPYQQYLVHQQMQMQMQMQRQMQALQNQSVTVPLVSSMPSTSENDHDANKDG